MTPQELAQKLADHFDPPHWEERRKTPYKDFKHLPLDERYERVWVQKTPESQPYIVTRFINEDGQNDASISAASFQEIAEAVLAVLTEKTEYAAFFNNGNMHQIAHNLVEAQDFVDSLNEVGAKMHVRSRTVFGLYPTEWTPLGN